MAGALIIERKLTCYDRYGMVLAKEKNDEKAMQFLIRSVHKYTMNWGCWLEMTSLISRAEDVSNRPGWRRIMREWTLTDLLSS